MTAVVEKNNKTLFYLVYAVFVILLNILWEIFQLLKGGLTVHEKATEAPPLEQKLPKQKSIELPVERNTSKRRTRYANEWEPTFGNFSTTIQVAAHNCNNIEIDIWITPVQHFYKPNLMHRLLEQRKINRFKNVRKRLDF